MPFPGTCPSSCCASPTWPISSWCARLIQAHAYWRLKGLAVDLVIWNEDRSGYRQVLQDQILGLVAVGLETQVMDRPGGIFVRSAEQISEEDRTLFQTVARVILSDSRGTLAEQVNRPGRSQMRVPRLRRSRLRQDETPAAFELPRRDLILFNGIGRLHAGWARVRHHHRARTDHTGAVGQRAGQSAFRHRRLGERQRLYLGRERPRVPPHALAQRPGNATRAARPFTCATRKAAISGRPRRCPARGATPYVSRHGFGYSVFEHTEDGIRLRAVRLCRHRCAGQVLRAQGAQPLRPATPACPSPATGNGCWATCGTKSAHARDHRSRSATAARCSRAMRTTPNFPTASPSSTCDEATADRHRRPRREFLGRNGTPGESGGDAHAAAVRQSGRGLDPCAAIQVPLRSGRRARARDHLQARRRGIPGGDDSSQLVQRFRGADGRAACPGSGLAVLEPHPGRGACRNARPSRSTCWPTAGSCTRPWPAACGRARGFYQSGGAFGFRDQLQDAMALVHAEPASAARAPAPARAARQFREGDVQHWWHPPAGRGRAHPFFRRLPVAAAGDLPLRQSTGDTGVLDERVPFPEGRPLKPDEESVLRSARTIRATRRRLYEHCVRAIQHGLAVRRARPAADGLRRLERRHEPGRRQHGKGESVWLAFFLYDVLTQFGDAGTPARRSRVRRTLREPKRRDCASNIEQHGWDGDWYRRAYFDDGTPLGSAANPECQIDSISQSWSVLSGAGDARARAHGHGRASTSAWSAASTALIQLLDPPFDKSDLESRATSRAMCPACARTAASTPMRAIWTAMAFAALGDSRARLGIVHA